MLTIYKTSGPDLSTVPEPVNNCWISLIDPTPTEVARVQALGVPADYLTYPLDLDERARTEHEDGQRLIILRIPYYQGETSDVPYTTVPLGIILTEQHIITVCKYPNDLVTELTEVRVKDRSTAKRLRLVLRILLLTANRYLANLRTITKRVDLLEDQLQQSTRNKEVLELLKYQKSLTYFTTALKSNELMLERLDRSRLFQTYPEDEDLLDDVITENQQAIEMVNITSNILSSMMDAFASIISNNLNVVMKFLAAVTIVLSFPTMIASFFGMNVELPFARHTLGFEIVLVVSVLVSIIVVFLFRKRDWL